MIDEHHAARLQAGAYTIMHLLHVSVPSVANSSWQGLHKT